MLPPFFSRCFLMKRLLESENLFSKSHLDPINYSFSLRLYSPPELCNFAGVEYYILPWKKTSNILLLLWGVEAHNHDKMFTGIKRRGKHSHQDYKISQIEIFVTYRLQNQSNWKKIDMQITKSIRLKYMSQPDYEIRQIEILFTHRLVAK